MKYASVVLQWLPLAVGITGMCLVVYATVQQSYRQSLNDPQVEIAVDAARSLAEGAVPGNIAKNLPTLDISQSLTPWMAVYDKDGKPLAYSGQLDGAAPQIPKGVFEAAATGHGKDTLIVNQNRVTWQPSAGVREAIVVQYYSDKATGFVVVGRNMIEVETRIKRLGDTLLVAWMGLMLSTFLVQLGAAYFRR